MLNTLDNCFSVNCFRGFLCCFFAVLFVLFVVFVGFFLYIYHGGMSLILASGPMADIWC